ncbi:MAG TPA: gamma carbonic anhydrase family protein, partial [Gemmatimonadaceae bacterium]|nr:gamma carbonic anhydrase family protein [Gemmatimonadaceae bacterium]
AVVGAGCVVGALCFVPADMVIPDRKVVVGNPAKIVKDVSDEMLAWKTAGTRIYQQLPARLHASLRECEALREVPAERRVQGGDYRTWKETRSKAAD